MARQSLLFADAEEADGAELDSDVKQAVANSGMPILFQPKITADKRPSRGDSEPRARKTSRETFRIRHGGMSRDVSLWLERRGRDHWEICGLPLQDCSESGPYTSQDEAEEDKAGLRRFWEENGKYADWGA